MDYGNQLIYQVFVRNHTKEGTFAALIPDLKRIKALGTDILYLLPIAKIGKKGRKGHLGSPYAIEDYRAINPLLGTWEDFSLLCKEAHALGMKVMVDQVFNHTSRDATLLSTHPEFYWKDKNGNFGNKVGDWADVYDLDYRDPLLTEYLLDTLDMYLDQGADGFRFDVASLIPISFFKALKERLRKRKNEVILLAECIESHFALYTRSLGYNACANGELAEAGVQLFYCYSSLPFLKEYLENPKETSLEAYRASCLLEEAALPQKGAYVVRALENHDQVRLASYGKGTSIHYNLLAYSFFTKGPAFLYAGEEIGLTHRPSLFDEDKLNWEEEGGEPIFTFVKKLISLKKRDETLSISTTLFPKVENLLVCENVGNAIHEWGIFNFSKERQILPSGIIPPGKYKNLLTDEVVLLNKETTLEVEQPLWLTSL